MTFYQTAVIINDVKSSLTLQDLDVPSVGDNEILIENKGIGLNPIDWKSKKYNFAIHEFPWINGRESCGKVVKLGRYVNGLSLGDNVIVASTSYRDLRTSTFQNFTVMDYRLVWKLPKFLTYDQGSSIGVGLVTASMIIYDSFKVFNEEAKGKSIIIWGASSVVGLYLIQLANIHGLKPIAVANKDYEVYLKDLGASIVIDRYRAIKDIQDDIKHESIQFGVDCVSETTSKYVLEILENFPQSKFTSIVKAPRLNSDKIVPVSIKKFHEDLALGQKIIKITSDYLESGQIKPVRLKVYKGLSSIEAALKDLEYFGAKAEKYIISV